MEQLKKYKYGLTCLLLMAIVITYILFPINNRTLNSPILRSNNEDQVGISALSKIDQHVLRLVQSVSQQVSSVYGDYTTSPPFMSSETPDQSHSLPEENRNDLSESAGDVEPPLNRTNMVNKVQADRHRLVSNVCRQLPTDGGTVWNGTIHYGQSLKGLGDCYTYEEHNILMCTNPKTGSGDLLKQLCWANTSLCQPNIQQYLKRAEESLLSTRTYFNSFFSFNTVRSPWTRLVSAYTEKFIYTEDYRRMCSVEMKWAEFDKLMTKQGQRWSFKDFIEKCVIDEWKADGPVAQNKHWRPQHVIGSFCALNYTFISKLETVDFDRRVLLPHFGFTDIVKLMSYSESLLEKKNTTSHTYSNLWASIDSDTIDILRTIYAIDLRMFDYPTSP